MARFLHWHGARGLRHHHWRRPHEPDFPLPPPLDDDEYEAEFTSGNGEEEMRHHGRYRPQRYQSGGGMGETENGFAPEADRMGPSPRTGRWMRRNDRIIVFGV